MTVAFNSQESEFWTNCFPTPTIDRFSQDIKKFGRVLKVIKYSEPIWAMISVETMLGVFGFSKEFGDVIVYPLTALFFGS